MNKQNLDPNGMEISHPTEEEPSDWEAAELSDEEA